jgi:hypothetical protein
VCHGMERDCHRGLRPCRGRQVPMRVVDWPGKAPGVDWSRLRHRDHAARYHELPCNECPMRPRIGELDCSMVREGR